MLNFGVWISAGQKTECPLENMIGKQSKRISLGVLNSNLRDIYIYIVY